MKVQYISSACVLVEHDDVRVLCDPWLTEGIYYGSWYHYPPLIVGPEDFHDVDYIYITHIHPDHCDVASLKKIPKNIPILIHQYEEKFLLNLIKNIGFDQVIEVAHKQPYRLGEDFSIEILAADNCDPTLCGRWLSCHVHQNPTKTLQIDSLGVFSGGGKVVVNTNDCPFALSKTVCEYILSKYQSIDFLLVGYSGAGPYPQCFTNLNLEEKEKAALQKRDQFLNLAISYISILKPLYFLPFAGQYTLGGSLSVLNPYRGVPELEELHDLFPQLLEAAGSLSKMVLLNSMESFSINLQKASASFIPPNKEDRSRYVRDVLSEKKYSYELISPRLNNLDDFYQKIVSAHQHLLSKLMFYGFSSPTNVYLDIGLEAKFLIPFNGDECSIISLSEKKAPYVEIGLHPGLLEMILDRKAHWNNAEIGSHLRIERSPNEYERGIYYFLSYFN